MRFATIDDWQVQDAPWHHGLRAMRRSLRDDEEGAVTVNWVALTAAVAALAAAVMSSIAPHTEAVAQRTSTNLAQVAHSMDGK